MVNMKLEEIKDLSFNYIIKEYLEDEDKEITCYAPLISSAYADSFSMVSLLVFLRKNSK
jgi:hypothetical protein